MEPRLLRYICAACEGEQVSGSADAVVLGVCTDSRRVRPGELFFALRGEHFDGHSFLGEAERKGCAGVVLERSRWPMPGLACAVVVVDDPRRALGRLGAKYRAGFNLPIVAVGGSNGKTTTKDLLATVLGRKLSVLGSEASFNNDLGVPLTLLRLDREHQVAVVEAGTNHPGELEPLLRMIQPQYGVLTSIGREHLEFFGDVAGVVQEEGWLAELLPGHGRLFINGDVEWAPRIVKRSRAGVVRVGFGEGNDWRAEAIRLEEGGTVFRVSAPARDFCGEYRVGLLGRHQAVNALLGMAVAEEMGLSPGQVREGLAACRPPKMRLELRRAGELRILDDAYNANVDSVAAALEVLAGLPGGGRRVAVLGDMAELGAQSEAAHWEVGREAARAGVAMLVAVGRWAPVMAAGARAGGMGVVYEFADVTEARAVIGELVGAGDVVLLKASRATGLERVSQALGRGT